MSDEIQNLGTGLVKQPEDPRDHQFAFIASGAAPIDWKTEYRLPEPPDFNQRTSDACVACATNNFHWQHKRKNYSRRDIFSRIALSYGAFLRDGVKTVVDIGQQTQDECPDPTFPTSQNMRVRSALPDSASADDKEDRYFSITQIPNIDQLAQAVRDWKGAIFGIYTYGWKDQNYPKPATQADGAHALYAFGYHTHSDGKKCLIAKSSWCTATHHEHHINEDHFAAARIFDGWVLVPKENLPMVRRFKVDDHGKLGVMLITDGSFDAVVFWAKNQDMLNRLLLDYEVPISAPTIVIP